MAALPKTPVVVRFRDVDQDRSPKNLVLGTLTEAVNCRQRKIGRFGKRLGLSALAKTTDNGTISDAKALGANSGSPVLQTSDAVYVRDATAARWRNKGAHAAVMPGTRDLVFGLRGCWPCHTVASGILYAFARDSSDGCIYYRAIDQATGVEIVGPTKVDSTTVTTYLGSKAVAAGGFAWLVYVLYNNPRYVVKVAKFDPANPTVAPTLTTYFTTSGAGNDNIRGIDVFMPAGGSYPAVAIHGFDMGTPSELMASYLDTATGGIKAAPGHVAVNVGSSAGTAALSCQGAGWLRGSGGDGDLWIAARAANNDLRIFQINESTLATTAATTLASGASERSVVTGYKSGASKVVFYSNVSSVEDAVTTRYVYTGSTTSSTFCRAGFVVSEPFQVASNWYVITGHDDVDSGTGAAANLQRAYYVRDASATDAKNIRARALYGLGGDLVMRGAHSTSGDGAGFAVGSFFTTVTVSGTTATSALNGNVGGAADFGTYLMTWEFSAALGAVLANIEAAHTLFPGGWPKIMTAESSIFEMGMPMFPRKVTVSNIAGTLTAGTRAVAALYVRPDRRGDLIRSAPSPEATITPAGQGVRVVIPTLRTVNSNEDVQIHIYMTGAGGSTPFLVKTVANNPDVDSITVDITAEPTYGEALYTEGGVLSNSAVPPFRAAFTWNDRAWLLGTEHPSEAWHSKQFAAGIAAEFAAPLKVTCYGGTGSLRAGGVVSADYAALFKRDAIFLVSGFGQDDTGAGGAFQVRRLESDEGCDNHASVVTYPGGLLYQSISGIINRVTTGGQVVDAGAKAQDYATATVYRAIHLPKRKEVRFTLSTGKVLVHDYGNASESAPDGLWYLDESTAWSCGAGGAVVIDDLAYYVESDGEVWREVESQFFDASNTPVLRRMKVPVQFADLDGEYRISRLHTNGEFVSAHDVRVAIAFDGGSATNHDATISAAPLARDIRPAGAGRVAYAEVTIEDRGGAGEGFQFDGLTFEVAARGRLKRVNSTQRI